MIPVPDRVRVWLATGETDTDGDAFGPTSTEKKDDAWSAPVSAR